MVTDFRSFTYKNASLYVLTENIYLMVYNWMHSDKWFVSDIVFSNAQSWLFCCLYHIFFVFNRKYINKTNLLSILFKMYVKTQLLCCLIILIC